MQSLIQKFPTKAAVSTVLKTTLKDYKPYTPAQYLYNRIIMTNHSKKNLEDYVELVYATLCAWNMNQRQAKLSEYSDFKKSILKYYPTISSLKAVDLNKSTDEQFSKAVEEFGKLFSALNLVAVDKPRIVTISKCLHYFLPDLVIPIDRSYTLMFYKGNTFVPKAISRQFKLFEQIQLDGRNFSKSINLQSFQDDRRNKTIPKTIDNLIIDSLQ